MKYSKIKLNNNSGASMLMALIVVLIVVTVSAVIVSAASSNAGRIKRNMNEQQAYLTVSSAAKLVRDSIVNNSNCFYALDCWQFEENDDGDLERVDVSTDLFNTGSASFSKAINYLVNSLDSGNATTEFIISSDGMDDVKLTMTMYNSTTKVGDYSLPQYGLKLVISLAADDATANSYITLLCVAQQTADETIGDIHLNTVRWTSYHMLKGEV